MENVRYVVKDFETGKYYAGIYYGFNSEPRYAEHFITIEDAINFINTQDGIFQMETIYVI